MNKITLDPSSKLVIAGDIGGTNANLALVEQQENGRFVILEKTRYSSQKLKNMEQGLSQAIELFASRGFKLGVRGICLSGAGPVVNNRCHTTNIPWDIDGNKIAAEFELPTIVINDFTAICYGIALLDPEKPSELTALPHPDGTMPRPEDSMQGIQVQAVVGAGTGLGIGFLVKEGGRVLVLPSEAGHSDFAAYDEDTRELQRYLHGKLKASPGAELCLSGQGIVNIHEFLCSRKGNPGAINKEILSLSREERAPKISGASGEDEICAQSMRIFVANYARFASSMALTFLPRGGLYLAGGIAAKNRDWFRNENRFMNDFLKNYKASIRPALSNVPVYIVEDYDISLPGAAHGYFNLERKFTDLQA